MLKRLDRYLLRETLLPLVFGLLLYSSLAVMSANFPRLQWVVGTPFGELLYWLALQFPAAIVQTLPIALLLAVLLAFGLLAASNELLAVQAGGVSLGRLSAQMLILGVGATLFALAMNQWALPQTNVKVASLWWQLSSGESGLFRLARQNLPLGDYTLSFDRVVLDEATQDETLFDVRLEAWQGQTLSVVFAASGKLSAVGLELYDYRVLRLDLETLSDTSARTPRAVLEQLVALNNRAASPESPLMIRLSETPERLITRYAGGGFEDARSLTDLYKDARNRSLGRVAQRDAAVLFHRKLAEPFANLTLLAVALPLAVLHARSRAVAFGLSLTVTLAWYLLLTVGQLLAQSGAVPVWLGLWFGNALLFGVGVYMLYARTNLR